MSPAKAPPHLTPADRAARGKAARHEVPRESHADYESSPSGRTRSTSSGLIRPDRGCQPAGGISGVSSR